MPTPPPSLPFALVALLAASSPAAAGDVQFALPEAILPDSSGDREIELADVDGDHDLDLIRLSALFVRVHRNDGAGKFTPDPEIFLPEWGQGLAVGDVDGDGDSDLVVVMNHSTFGLVALLNHGDGTFALGPVTPVGPFPSSVDVGDLDGDGRLDAVLANWKTETITLHFGDGAGGFSAGTPYAMLAGFTYDTVLADLDGDLDLDVAVANFGSEPTYTVHGEVWVLANDGAGVLGPPDRYVVGRGTMYVRAADMDRDGDLDLVATNRNTFDVSVLEGRGDGTFEPSVETPAPEYPYDATPTDVDGDGYPDVLVPGYVETGRLDVLRNDGSGALVPELEVRTTGNVFTLAAGDVDRDGDVDFVVDGLEIELYRSLTPQATDPLVSVNHLVAGQTALVTAAKIAPGAPAFVAFSLQGAVPPYDLPVIDASLALAAPKLLASGAAGPDGTSAWTFPLAPSTQGVAVWLQALTIGGSSGVIATQIH